MQIVIIGAGPAGLFLGSALARRGHRVTAVDRDPGPADDATWARRGVMQFHHAHAFRQTVVEALGREVPEALDLWLAAGAEPIEFEDYGGAGDPARAALAPRDLRARACAPPPWRRPGFTLRHGHVESVLERGRPRRRRASWTAYRWRPTSSSTRRGAPAGRPEAWRSAPGSADRAARRTSTASTGCKPGRRARADDQPDRLAGRPRRLPVAGLPARAGPVLGARSSGGPTTRRCAACATTDAFEAAARAIPGLDVWTDPERAEPVTDVLAGGALLNVYRSQCDERRRARAAGAVLRR